MIIKAAFYLILPPVIAVDINYNLVKKNSNNNKILEKRIRNILMISQK